MNKSTYQRINVAYDGSGRDGRYGRLHELRCTCGLRHSFVCDSLDQHFDEATGMHAGRGHARCGTRYTYERPVLSRG